MKKGQIFGNTLSFFLAFFMNILALVVLFFLIVPNFSGDAEYRIEKAFTEHLDASFISGYLFRFESPPLGILLIESHLTDDYEDFTESSDALLQNIFEKETPWRLYVDGKKTTESCHEGCNGPHTDHFATLPTPYGEDNQLIHVRLQVYS